MRKIGPIRSPLRRVGDMQENWETTMNAWTTYTLIYSAAYGLISLTIFLLLPSLIRVLATRVMRGLGEVVVVDLKERSRGLLQQGREQAMLGPETPIVGHLVEPYLERFTTWTLEKMNRYQQEHLGERYADACVGRLCRYRWIITLAVAQAVMTLLAIGYIARGVL